MTYIVYALMTLVAFLLKLLGWNPLNKTAFTDPNTHTNWSRPERW
jgi:hypothetical protein